MKTDLQMQGRWAEVLAYSMLLKEIIAEGKEIWTDPIISPVSLAWEHSSCMSRMAEVIR
jgi:hypothetical protein